MRIYKFLLFFVIFCLSEANAQRVSGYYPNYQYPATNYMNIQFQKLTHLYYFSLNPTRTVVGQSDGSLWFNDPFSWFTTTYFNNVVSRARALNPNIKIMLVTGGAPGGDADLNNRLSFIAQNPGRLNTFCNNIINFIKANNLDGWDLDWEFPTNATERNYHEAMLARMRQKIDSMKMADCKYYEISIAVGGGYTDCVCFSPCDVTKVNATVINHVDIVNIMSYDGSTSSPWNPSCSFSSHQHYDRVVKAFTDWTTTYPSWPRSKFALGVGFYDNNGVTFGSGGNNSTYYNNATYWGTGGSGCPNMRSKIDYARTQGTAGTFIWEITQDVLCSGTVPACYSLLDCMYQHTISTWGTWTAPSNPCSMPVKLSRFEGVREDNSVKLTWVTTEEINHSHFEIQSSSDGIHFKSKFILQSGTNAQGSIYEYQDFSPSRYYRLKIVSLAGEEEYSHVIQVAEDDRFDCTVYPNPFSNELVIKIFNSEEAEILLTDLAGNELFHLSSVTEKKISINPDCSSGVYLLRISSNNAVIYKKIVKE